MSLLAPVAFDFADGHALNAKRRQRLAHFVELERLDDSRDEFHSDPLFGLSSAVLLGSQGLPKSRIMPVSAMR
jgi:hypothetical protein